MLSARELTSIRADMARMMGAVASIVTVDEVYSSEGTETDTAGITTGIPCHYQVLSGRELERAQKLSAEAQVAVYLPANTVVAITDQITISNSAGLSPVSSSLQVVAIVQRTQELHRVVYCKDFTP